MKILGEELAPTFYLSTNIQDKMLEFSTSGFVEFFREELTDVK